jgi:hypothetical protein
MKNSMVLALIATVCALALPVELKAQDTVTIPKSRLEELERKAAELDRLKGDHAKTQAENKQLQQKHDAAVAKLATLPAAAPATNTSAPVATLPAPVDGEEVLASDLGNYFKFEPQAAAQRYEGRRIRVRGEIAGFGSTPFTRSYQIHLRTPDPTWRVSGHFTADERYKAVFPSSDGTELMAVISDAKTPIMKTGEVVVLEGVCRGTRKNAIVIGSARLVRP